MLHPNNNPLIRLLTPVAVHKGGKSVCVSGKVQRTVQCAHCGEEVCSGGVCNNANAFRASRRRRRSRFENIVVSCSGSGFFIVYDGCGISGFAIEVRACSVVFARIYREGFVPFARCRGVNAAESNQNPIV